MKPKDEEYFKRLLPDDLSIASLRKLSYDGNKKNKLDEVV